MTPDEALLEALPSRIGEVDFEGYVLEFGGVPPANFSDDLGRALLAATDRNEPDLSVAWIEAAPSDAERNFGLSMMAIRVRGADSTRLRQVVVGDRALIVGPASRLDDDGTYVFVRNSLVATSGDVAYLVSFPVEADLSQSPPPNSVGWTMEDFRSALPRADDIERQTGYVAEPSLEPGVQASDEPDLQSEELLPDAIRDVTLTKVSARGRQIFAMPDDPLLLFRPLLLGLPAYALLRVLDLDPDELAAAAGYAEALSSFAVTATRAPGADRRLLVGALVDEFASQGSRTLETLDIDGNRVQILDDVAMFAEDNLFYWMAYLDFGDRFGATLPPRPSLHDLVVDTVHALPARPQ